MNLYSHQEYCVLDKGGHCVGILFTTDEGDLRIMGANFRTVSVHPSAVNSLTIKFIQ
jgi:hypothetical protein